VCVRDSFVCDVCACVGLYVYMCVRGRILLFYVVLLVRFCVCVHLCIYVRGCVCVCQWLCVNV